MKTTTEYSIQSVTPTLCQLMNIAYPAICDAAPVDSVCQIARNILDGEPVQKCLIYAPDALGNHLIKLIPDFVETIQQFAPLAVPVRSVMPSVTPVCFASIFTGALPARHGIQQYEKPVLTCDTFFDALLRARRKVAIVAVTNCSVDRIFRGRELGYFSEPDDPAVTDRALSLLESNHHDVILAYHQEYDDTLHRTTPFSHEAILAARNHIKTFMQLNEAFDWRWQSYHRAICMITDHGAHLNPATGCGDHGDDIPEDMELTHFYGIRSRRK